MCVLVHVYMSTQRPKEDVGSLKQELKVVMSYLMRVLEIELRSL